MQRPTHGTSPDLRAWDTDGKSHLPKNAISWSIQKPKLSWLVKNYPCWRESVTLEEENAYSGTQLPVQRIKDDEKLDKDDTTKKKL